MCPPVIRVLAFACLALSSGMAAADEPPKDAAPPTDLYGDPLPDGAVARLGSTRLRLSPDGQRAFTALADGTALVWDLAPALRPAEPLVKEAGEKEIVAWWTDL